MASPVLDYEKLYQAAAAKWGVPASVLAGDVQVESGGNENAVSPTGAFGLTQFEPSTASEYGVQRGNPESQIMGQAKYLHDLGFSSNPTLALDKYNAGPGDPSAAGNYAQKVLAAAKAYASLNNGGSPSALGKIPMVSSNFTGAGGSGAPNVFDALAGLEEARQVLNNDTAGVDPLQSGWDILAGIVKGQQPATSPSSVTGVQPVTTVGSSLAVPNGSKDINPLAHFTIGRTDMGVDANAKPGTPILAPNTAKVVAIYPNWYSGQPYLLIRLTAGPNKGRYIYVAEQITNLAQPGTTVRRGQPIAYYAPTGTGIEIGWGTPGWQTQAQAQGNTGSAGHSNSPSGANFRNYLNTTQP